jgi:hypothetical protein
MTDRTRTPETVAKELRANPPKVTPRPQIDYSVTLSNSGGHYLLQWQEDVAGSYDWVALYPNSSVPDSEYDNSCNYNWNWAQYGNSYLCCATVAGGHQARYLIWDANAGAYVSVARSNIL